MKAYKAFRVDALGRPRFLFHGNHGSTLVTLDTWMRAQNKVVRDGNGERYYESGFHACMTLAEMERWRAQTKYKYVVVEVEVRQFQLKRGAKQEIILADYLYVSSVEWRHALAKFEKEALVNV